LTYDSVNRSPIWNPVGQRVTFSSNRFGPLNLFEAPLDGSAAAERLTVSDNLQFPGSWSADGSLLAFVEHHPVTGRDIWIFRRDGRETSALVVSPHDETAPALTSDGRWLAYVSNRTGAAEVYVRALSEAGSERLLSTRGGSEPVWSRDGRQVFYREGSRLVGVPVTLGNRIQTGPARPMFNGSFAAGTADRANFDVAASTGRFVMVEESSGPSSATEFHVLLNWKVPAPSAR
jgi:Tol biopolymer transport system component